MLKNLQFGRSSIMWSSVCVCGRALRVQVEKLETSNDANGVLLTQVGVLTIKQIFDFQYSRKLSTLLELLLSILHQHKIM